MNRRECPWRYTAESPRFFGVIDARAVLPFVVLLFHMRWWVFYLACCVVGLFVVLSWYRITPVQGLRALGLWIVTLGYRRPFIGHRPRRQRVDWE